MTYSARCSILAHVPDLGERIAAARGRAGMTQAQLASAVSLDRSVLAKIETGQRRVGALELARVAEALDERVEWFVTEAPEAIVSHRNLQEPGTPSPRIDRIIERVARSVEFVQENGDLALATTSELTLPGGMDQAEKAAIAVRSNLGLNATEPVLEIAQRVIDLGLLAFSFDLGTDSADAASILLRHGGIAVVNGSLHVGRRRLALAHELGHYVFADEYTVDWRVAEHGDESGWEARLDRFARAVLLPEAGLTAEWTRRRDGGADVRTAAVYVASTFRVDMSTLARRLQELRLADPSAVSKVRGTRTTRADIVELDLVVPHELEASLLPRPYEEAVLRLYRNDDVSPARAIDLFFDTWSEADLPDLPVLPEDAIWKFVS